MSRYDEWRAETAEGARWSAAELRAIDRLVQDVRAACGLRDAHVELLPNRGPEGAIEDARSYVFSQSDHIEIRLHYDFRSFEARRQVQIVVHELLHAIFEPVIDFVDTALSDEVGGPTWRPFERTLQVLSERQIDRLAMGLTPKFRSIRWPVK